MSMMSRKCLQPSMSCANLKKQFKNFKRLTKVFPTLLNMVQCDGTSLRPPILGAQSVWTSTELHMLWHAAADNNNNNNNNNNNKGNSQQRQNKNTRKHAQTT
jgi:hypothetical protein